MIYQRQCCGWCASLGDVLGWLTCQRECGGCRVLNQKNYRKLNCYKFCFYLSISRDPRAHDNRNYQPCSTEHLKCLLAYFYLVLVRFSGNIALHYQFLLQNFCAFLQLNFTYNFKEAECISPNSPDLSGGLQFFSQFPKKYPDF